MGSPDVLKALRNPGRLAVQAAGQTFNVTTVWPHGGTGLGSVVRARLLRHHLDVPVRTEEYGIEPVEFVEAGEWWVLSAALRGWDNDAILAVFANTTLSTPSAFRGVDHPGTVRAGSRGSASGLRLLFTPDDPTRHPAVYFAWAAPETADELEWELGADREALLAVEFKGLRSSTGKGIQVRLLEDVSL